MKGTKQSILRAAKLLFNNHGVPLVSQRNIADHIAISPGNLTYHFNKREDIIEALFLELSEEIQLVFAQFDKDAPDLGRLFSMMRDLNKIYFEHRYFVNDFKHISITCPRIKKAHRKLAKQKEKTLLECFQFFNTQKLMCDESFEGEYSELVKRSIILNELWVIGTEMNEKEVKLKHGRLFAENFVASLHPYLTKKGQELIKEFVA